MTLESDDYSEIARILQELADLPHEARDARLQEKDLSAGVRDRISSLLVALSEGRARIRTGDGADLAGGPSAGTPENLGPYRVLETLGRGGQGVVYLCDDPRLGRKVAVKVLLGMSFAGDEVRRRFLREAEVASRLDDPGLCTVYEVGDHGGFPYIAMRYVDGEPLAARIARRAASPEPESMFESFGSETGATEGRPVDDDGDSRSATADAGEIDALVRIVESTARSLHVAHEAGLVHRDIKPANIMIDREERPCILDFGLVHVESDESLQLTATGQVMGTPAYMAPEQIRGDVRAIDRRTDVYALGVTLYEALTSRRPFAAGTRDALYKAILAGDCVAPARLNRAVGKDLSVVVLTAMDAVPDARYATALELAEDLRRVLRREPVVARPIGAPSRLARWASREPWLAFSLAAIVFISVFLSTLNHFGRRRAEENEQRYERLADKTRAEDLIAEARRLWPPHPGLVDPAREWLLRARDLLDSRPLHQAALAALEPESARATAEARFRHAALLETLARFDELEGEGANGVSVASVTWRLERAREIVARTIDDHEQAWEDAIDEAEDRFGIMLDPLVGLIPLGVSQDGYLEFSHWLTGEPRRAGRPVDDDTGVVFILLPGGDFTVGRKPPKGVQGGFNQYPRQVKLAPFLISKYELSEGQYRRLMGSEPSQIRGKEEGRAYPVDSISWRDAQEFATRAGALLPTEAQWEYAARQGDVSCVYPWGRGTSSLRGKVNVLGSERAFDLDPTIRSVDPWDDGYPYKAPIDALGRNRFGLFGLCGNMSEWTRDRYVVRPGSNDHPEGLVVSDEAHTDRTLRDTNYDEMAGVAHPLSRGKYPEEFFTRALGVRVVMRAVTR